MLIKFITAWTCKSEASPATFFYASHCTGSLDQILTPEAHLRLLVKPQGPMKDSLEAKFGFLNL